MIKQEQEQENSWLIDLILSFFHSAEWKAPIMSFIEEKWIVFDDEEEFKLEYTIIHKEFKQLAEGLIEGMLTELSATPQMFGEAMEKASDSPGYQKITKIIEAIDNYQKFHQMMKKKNAALNEAAFKLLQEGTAESSKESTTKRSKIMKIEQPKTMKSKSTAKTHRKKEIKSKKELGHSNTLKTQELSELEREQIELLKDMSKREEDERK